MSESRNDLMYIHDILEAIEKIMAYLSGITYEDFLNDIKNTGCSTSES
jgi:uncharacterized protein with HEPN domain